jgi:PPOX class probable F420-dependent enzyme
MFDLSGDFGQRVARRLQQEEIIWLTTTGGDATPQPRPVWFFWNGETILIYSRRNAAKVRHIGLHPQVALNFNSTSTGGDVVVILGKARIVETVPEADLSAYLVKYAEGIKRINLTADSMLETFRTAILVTPSKLRGH